MIKPGVMLMNDCGPDGQPWDWKAKLAEWKAVGLQGVDVFQMFLTRTGLSLKDMKAVLDDLGLLPTVYCIPTDLPTRAKRPSLAIWTDSARRPHLRRRRA